ncbi:ABC transporter ATP-binding protein [Ramlibacter sp. 2FC]|uniref:ABC transporter ATP-binding protein n=1 Tax=Ramlibacter sp. 2FC TaxID=2502188 RepID=UPI0010F89B0C|nr:ABC transporter ATP-binding protein [Ramlibacter sp. 2FC]
MSNISIRSVEKRYGEVVALNNVSLEVRQGEFLTLLGPSGSGKTTLLSMIAGLAHPDSGQIYLGDRNVTDLPPNKRNIGLVFQSFALFPHMSVRENVAFPLKIRKLPEAQITPAVNTVLERVKLTGLSDRKISQLSGGQQQRVALARALVFEPSILLLDEPLGALDKNLREDLQFELKQLHSSLGITTIMVTHDQEEAMSLSDRIAVFNAGRIEQIGRPSHIYRNPASRFVARFLGTGNIVRGAVNDSNGDRFVVSESGLRLNIPTDLNSVKVGGAAEVMLRPESISLRKSVAGDGIKGKILGRVYLGAANRYRVQLPHGEIFTIHAPCLGEEFVEGEEVGLSWSHEDVRLVGA